MVLKGTFATLKKSYHEKKRQKFLEKHGCFTEEEYSRRYDPDINWREDNINRFYRGYPYVFVFTNDHNPLWAYGDWDKVVDEIKEWCNGNIIYNYRHDFHRVIHSEWNGGWHRNEIGGFDYLFFAFKDEKDFVWFSLKWGG
jgi:hypothetical protein